MSDNNTLHVKPTKRRDRIQIIVFAVSALVYFPLSQWVTTTSIGTAAFLGGQMIYLFLLMAVVLAMPVLTICLFFQRTHRQSLLFLMFSVVFISSCIGGIILGQKTRIAGMRAFAQRSQALINAINTYEQDHSAPPPSLNDLVPEYIPAVPSMGMMAYPEYRYDTGDEAEERYAGNAWALSVFTSSGFINFDMMLYIPNQNYPQYGYGGWLEPVGNRAYVHE